MVMRPGERFTSPGAGQLATRRSYDVNNRLQYEGECLPPVQDQGGTPSWRIKRYEYDAGGRILSILWADRNQEFDKAWNLRATYAY